MDEHDDWDIVSGVGITALMIAATRAMESTRDDALINDPYAEIFVTRSGTTVPMSTSWVTINNSEDQSEANEPGPDLQAGMASYLGMFSCYTGARSRFFDDYFRDASTAGVRQVVILGAGLDSRAFRLPWPPHVELFEIDAPKVLEFKDSVLEEQGARAGCARHAVPIDLRADWLDALLHAGFDPQHPTAWLAEGLLLFLSGTAAETLLTHVHRLSTAGSWFAAEEVDTHARTMIYDVALKSIEPMVGEMDIATLWPADNRPDPLHWLHEHHWQATAINGTQAAARYGRTLDHPISAAYGECTLLTAHLT